MVTFAKGKPCGLKDQIHPDEMARFDIGEGRLLHPAGDGWGR